MNEGSGFLAIGRPAGCCHDDLSQLIAECEGYEDPTEPLQIRILCLECRHVLTVAIDHVQDAPWEPE